MSSTDDVSVYRLAGGHVGSFGQLQHHSEGTEVAFQHVTRGRRHLGKKQHITPMTLLF